MDNVFAPEEQLYRAVYPPEQASMFWRRDGSVSSAAFADPKGLSVERGYYRDISIVIAEMQKRFTGAIVSVSVGDCLNTDAVVRYLPSNKNPFHSEIHGSRTVPLLSKTQRFYLARRAVIRFYPNE
ncbi:MAG: hypothetical protein IK128_01750 [Clostridiales bacterium]|nr:hypothetical protein [Clostridiales bacterium]